MRISSVPVLLAFCVPSVLAQNQKPLSVFIAGETRDSQKIAQAIAARIGSTTRYTVGEMGSEELWLDIMCFKTEKLVVHTIAQGVDGYVCSYNTEYFPSQLKPFQSSLGVGKIQSGPFAYMVEEIFDDFVSETNDEKMIAARREILHNVMVFCENPERKNVCGTQKAKP